jgi:PKD repeat protein
MRKHFLTITLIALSLAACGGDEGPADGIGESNQAPVARLTLPEAGRVGEVILLDGASSTDDVLVTGWWFDPGDGSAVLRASSPQLTHTFTQPGAYTVTLSVLDDTGTKDTDRAQIIIQ